MTNRIFKEVSPGIVAHSACVLAEDEPMAQWVGFCVDDIQPAVAQTVAAMKSYPSASEPTWSGFCVANGTVDKEAIFATFGRSPPRAKRMGGASTMTSFIGGEGYEVSYLVDNCDWGSIDEVGGTVVDIGGSHGFVCVDLAKRWKNTHFIGQDLLQAVASAPDLGEIGDRIVVQAHDYHTTQPVTGFYTANPRRTPSTCSAS